MKRVLVFCLIVLSLMSQAFAEKPKRELSTQAKKELFLTDLFDIPSGQYAETCAYSHFPNPERKLRLLSNPARCPFDRIYARAQARVYTVRPNDTLLRIAWRQGSTVELIKEENRLATDRLKPGQRLWIPDPAITLEINKTLNRLYVKSRGVLIKEYPVSTGKSIEQTPEGIFLIGSRYPFPTWFHKGVVVSAGSPENYLGSRWLGFDKPQFGIHGTIFPEMIGLPASKGCIRMKNEDVEELYEYIPVGTVVIVTDI